MTGTPDRPEIGPEEPVVPHKLPFGITPVSVLAWVEELHRLPTEEDRLNAIRGQIKAMARLEDYVRGWRAVIAKRMIQSGAKLGDIARAAGVSDSYVSRRMKELGMERRTRRRRSPEQVVVQQVVQDASAALLPESAAEPLDPNP